MVERVANRESGRVERNVQRNKRLAQAYLEAVQSGDGKIVEFKEYSDTELVTRVVFGGKSRLNTA